MDRNIQLVAVPVISQILLEVPHMIEQHKFFALEIPFELSQVIIYRYHNAVTSIYELIEPVSHGRLALIATGH